MLTGIESGSEGVVCGLWVPVHCTSKPHGMCLLLNLLILTPANAAVWSTVWKELDKREHHQHGSSSRYAVQIKGKELQWFKLLIHLTSLRKPSHNSGKEHM